MNIISLKLKINLTHIIDMEYWNKQDALKFYNISIESNNEMDSLFHDEFIKLLCSRSREFRKFYQEIAHEVLTNLQGYMQHKEQTEKTIQQLMNTIDIKADELQRTINLLKGTYYVAEGRYDIANEYMDILPQWDSLPFIATPFKSYANRFIRTVQKAAIDHMRQTEKFPSAENLVKATMCKFAKNQLEWQIKAIDFSEDNIKENFWEISALLEEEGIQIEASENIQQSFIKLCRSKYPQAKKSLDYLFENKKFRNEYINQICNNLTPFLKTYFNAVVEDTKKAMEEWKIIWEYHSNITNNILFNYHVFVKNNYVFEGQILWKYFLEVLNAFKEDHNKKIKAKEKPIEKEKTPILSNDDIPMQTQDKNGRKFQINEETHATIEEAISHIKSNEQKKSSMIKYIAKLLIKDLPFKFNDFKKIFNLQEIPEETITIITEKLWMEYEIGKEEKESTRNKKTESRKWENITENTKTTEDTTPTKKIPIEETEKYFLEHIKTLWFSIKNENLLKKQIEEFCKNNRHRTTLNNLLKNPEVGKVLAHKWGHKKARILAIWRTGRRLLLIKDWEKIEVDGFYNHNDYLNNLAKIKN